MKRKTITFSREIYDALQRFSDSDRLAIYDSLFNTMFNGAPPAENLTDTQFMAHTVFAPQLRLIQMRYDNGKKGGRPVDKTTQNYAKGVFCPSKITENKPKYNQDITNPDAYINNIPCNNININNKYNTSINQTTNQSHAVAWDTEKVNFYHELLLDKLKELGDTDASLRLEELINRIARENQPFNINGQEITPDAVLERFIELFRKDSALEINDYIHDLFYVVNTAPTKITNRYKYAVSTFYNASLDL